MTDHQFHETFDDYVPVKQFVVTNHKLYNNNIKIIFNNIE